MAGGATLSTVDRARIVQVEVQDEKNPLWRSRRTVHEVLGQAAPVVVAESVAGDVVHSYETVIVFLCKSIAEADEIVRLCHSEAVLILSHGDCADLLARDIRFAPTGVQETRWGYAGWRLVAVDAQVLGAA